MKKFSTVQITFFLLTSLTLVVFLISVTAPSRLHLRNTLVPISSPIDDHLRILVGILSKADKVEVRHLIRLVNSFQSTVPGATIDVRFVFCRLTRDEQRVYVGLEILRYDDIIMVDCPKENLNNGKTYLYFSTVARLFNRTGDGRPPYDYVMKADDDTFMRFPELVASLRPLPRKDLYYGHLHLPGNPAKDVEGLFMCGMGYVLSWDIVEWIGETEIARNNTVGLEDKLVAKWLREGQRGKNVYDTRPSDSQVAEWRSGGDRIFDSRLLQYNLPVPPMPFVPNTISVHWLKDRSNWASTLRYFNVTAGANLDPIGS